MNDSPTYIEALREEIAAAPAADLPALAAMVEGLRAAIWMRINQPSPLSVVESATDSDPDGELLTVDETAAILKQKPAWVRAHQDELPRMNLPGRSVRFSEKRLKAWMKRRSFS